MGISLESLGLSDDRLAEVKAAMERAPRPHSADDLVGMARARARARVQTDAPPTPMSSPPPTIDDLRALLGLPRPVPEAVSTVVAVALDRYHGMNRGEAKFAREYLEPKVKAGAVLWWSYGGVKLRLAEHCWYTADFFVIELGGGASLYDVKGRKGDSWWAEEDSRIKMRVTAHQWPFPLYVAWPIKGGGWMRERIGGSE